MNPITVCGVENDRKELIQLINDSDLTQVESGKIMGLFDNIIQSYEVELKKKIPRLMNSVIQDLERGAIGK